VRFEGEDLGDKGPVGEPEETVHVLGVNSPRGHWSTDGSLGRDGRTSRFAGSRPGMFV
jgi:hypothetical protein